MPSLSVFDTATITETHGNVGPVIFAGYPTLVTTETITGTGNDISAAISVDNIAEAGDLVLIWVLPEVSVVITPVSGIDLTAILAGLNNNRCYFGVAIDRNPTATISLSSSVSYSCVIVVLRKWGSIDTRAIASAAVAGPVLNSPESRSTFAAKESIVLLYDQSVAATYTTPSGAAEITQDSDTVSFLLAITTQAAAGSIPDYSTTSSDSATGNSFLVAVSPALLIFANDFSILTESVTGTRVEPGITFDEVSVTEGIAVNIADLALSRSDTISIAEVVSIATARSFLVSDQATVTENLTLRPSVAPSVSDNSSYTESVQINSGAKQASVFDAATVTESVSLNILSDGEVFVVDQSSVSEDTTFTGTSLLSVFNTATVAESSPVVVAKMISVFDTATGIESRTITVSTSILVFEGPVVTEEILFGSGSATASFSVSDNSTYTENVRVFVYSPVPPTPADTSDAVIVDMLAFVRFEDLQ